MLISSKAAIGSNKNHGIIISVERFLLVSLRTKLLRFNLLRFLLGRQKHIAQMNE